MVEQAGNQQKATHTPESVDGSRGVGLSEPILIDPHQLTKDMQLAAKAVKERWPIPEEKRATLINRLMAVVQKETVSVPTMHGIVELDGPADSNAVAAARVVVAMMGQNQADEHAALPQAGTTVNVAVVNGAVKVEQDDDWYGNRQRIDILAADRLADSAGAPTESHP